MLEPTQHIMCTLKQTAIRNLDPVVHVISLRRLSSSRNNSNNFSKLNVWNNCNSKHFINPPCDSAAFSFGICALLCKQLAFSSVPYHEALSWAPSVDAILQGIPGVFREMS